MGSVFSVFGYCHWRSWAGNLKLESEFLNCFVSGFCLYCLFCWFLSVKVFSNEHIGPLALGESLN